MMKNKSRETRYTEIDIWRGVAVILMISYHALVVWTLMFQQEIRHFSLLPTVIARAASTSFLVIVGLSSYLSSQRRLSLKQPWRKIERHFYKRGLIIFGWGLVITICSYLVIPAYTIVFGILHMIGISMLFMPALLQYKVVRLSMVLISYAVLVIQYSYGSGVFPKVMAGFVPQWFSTLDYWPIFPWITLIIIGIELGRKWYAGGIRQYKLSEIRISSPLLVNSARFVEFIGKHALFAYLLHVPIIFVLFWIFQQFS